MPGWRRSSPAGGSTSSRQLRPAWRRPLASPPEPVRTCVGCRQAKPRSQLQRLGLADGAIVINPRRLSGRSAYLCPDERCWATAEKRRAVDRALQVHLTAQDWARLREGILS